MTDFFLHPKELLSNIDSLSPCICQDRKKWKEIEKDSPFLIYLSSHGVSLISFSAEATLLIYYSLPQCCGWFYSLCSKPMTGPFLLLLIRHSWMMTSTHEDTNSQWLRNVPTAHCAKFLGSSHEEQRVGE